MRSRVCPHELHPAYLLQHAFPLAQIFRMSRTSGYGLYSTTVPLHHRPAVRAQRAHPPHVQSLPPIHGHAAHLPHPR
jgi:hypothetical protein